MNQTEPVEHEGFTLTPMRDDAAHVATIERMDGRPFLVGVGVSGGRTVTTTHPHADSASALKAAIKAIDDGEIVAL